MKKKIALLLSFIMLALSFLPPLHVYADDITEEYKMYDVYFDNTSDSMYDTYYNIQYYIGIPLEYSSQYFPLFCVKNISDDSDYVYLYAYIVDNKTGNIYGYTNKQVDGLWNSTNASEFYAGTIDELPFELYYSCNRDDANNILTSAQYFSWFGSRAYDISGTMEYEIYNTGPEWTTFFNINSANYWQDIWQGEPVYNNTYIFDYIDIVKDENGIAYLEYGMPVGTTSTTVKLKAEYNFSDVTRKNITTDYFTINNGSDSLYTNSDGVGCTKYKWKINPLQHSYFFTLKNFSKLGTITDEEYINTITENGLYSDISTQAYDNLNGKFSTFEYINYRLQIFDEFGNYGPVYYVDINADGSYSIYELDDDVNADVVNGSLDSYFVNDMILSSGVDDSLHIGEEIWDNVEVEDDMDLLEKILHYVKSTWENIKFLPEYIWLKFSLTLAEIAENMTFIVWRIGTLVTDVSNIGDVLRDVFLAVKNIGSIITEPIRELFEMLFIPKDNVFDVFVDLVGQKYFFVIQIYDIFNSFVLFITESAFNEPPTVTIPLSNIKSGLFGGMKDFTITFDWFEDWKPMTDLFISGFLWLKYVVWLFHSIPSIISGIPSPDSSGVPDRVDDIPMHSI